MTKETEIYQTTAKQNIPNTSASDAGADLQGDSRAYRTIQVQNAEGDENTVAQIVVQNKPDFEPKVSVIIPVYNVEDYLRECLDSVVNQTLKEIEIICVNDGSTDGSSNILKEYAAKDNRITVITQRNINAGVARNAGLSVAKGEYIGFVDSDDYISCGMYEKLYKKSKNENLSICVCAYSQTDNDSKCGINTWCIKHFKQDQNGNIINEPRKPIIQITNPAPWNKIYNGQFIKVNKIAFQSIISTNDVAFTVNALCLAKVIGLINENLYFYRTGTNKSLTDTKDKNLLCFYDAIKEVRRRLEVGELYESYYQSYINACVGYWIYNLNKVNNYNKGKLIKILREEFFKEIGLTPDNISLLYNPDYRSKCQKVMELGEVPSVTVILPVYNAELYLRECLDSVINQTLKNIEIICVNDGSTDGSLRIIKEYAERDVRIKYIDKPNAGYGHTMNCGLNIATGEYIGIVEPDDFVKPQMYETLYRKAKENDLDIIKADYYKFESHHGVYQYKKERLINKANYYNRVICADEYPDLLIKMTINPAGIFKREFLREYDIKHNETPGAAYQDNGFFIQTMYQADRIMFIDTPCYCYRQDNPNQSMRKKNNIWTIPDEYDFIDGLFDKSEKLRKLRSFYCYRKFIAYSYHLKARISRDYWEEYLRRMYKSFLKEKIYLDLRFFPPSDAKELNLILNQQFSEYIDRYAPPKISIIVPVYNTADFLPECLDSLIHQTLKEIEIICIDDGSTDNSLAILRKYAKNDRRIKVLTQKNKKQGAARNKGIKIARGEYIQFVDSDDYLSLNACEGIYKNCVEFSLDMLSFSGINFKNDTRELQRCPYNEFRYLPEGWDGKVLDYGMCKRFLTKMAVSTWCTVYRRDYINEHHLKFPENKYFEDNLFFTEAIIRVNRLYIDKTTYYYRRLHGESTTQNWGKHFPDYLDVTDALLQFLKDSSVEASVFNDYKYSYLNRCISLYTSFGRTVQKRCYLRIKKLLNKYDAKLSHRIVSPFVFSAYVLFVPNLIKRRILSAKYLKELSKNVLKQLNTARIDFKNIDDASNAIQVKATNGIVHTPGWFIDAKGAGQVLSSAYPQVEANITAVKGGRLMIRFRGADYRFGGNRFPVWIDYQSIRIDGKEVITEPIPTWHDKPFIYEMPVKDGQVVTIEYQTQLHSYEKQELRDTILKLNSSNKFIQDNIGTITTKIYRQIVQNQRNISEISSKTIDVAVEEKQCKGVLVKADRYPDIMADFFLPIGFFCRSAEQLRANNLRFCSLPFDWLERCSLSFITKTIKDGVEDWFQNYYEQPSLNTPYNRCVYDSDFKFGARHAFPLDRSVGEYLPEFRSLFRRRHRRMIDLFEASKIICFVCDGRPDTPDDFYRFLREVEGMYPNRTYFLVHIRHSEDKRGVYKYNFGSNITIYDIVDNDADENGNWRGNSRLWKDICDKWVLSDRFSDQRIVWLGSKLIKMLNRVRIDFKNNGTADNTIMIEPGNAIVSAPRWFVDEKGKGMVLISENACDRVNLTAVKDGKLQIIFRGMDYRYGEKRFPVWIDWHSIRIDGKEILTGPVQTWHDRPFLYEMPVKDGQKIQVEYKTQCHNYEKEELKNTILRLHPNIESSQISIEKLIDQIEHQILQREKAYGTNQATEGES